MFDCNLHWGLLFGGDNALLFQRCTLEHQPQRYGLLCSGILQIDRFFVTILGMLLVPGDRPLVNMAELAISVPSAYSPGDNQALVRAKRKALGYTAEDNHSQEQGMIMISTALVRSVITHIICPAQASSRIFMSGSQCLATSS